MADTKGRATSEQQGQGQRRSGQEESRHPEQRQEQSMQRRAQRPEYVAASPFAVMRRIADEMDRTFDRMFGDFGLPAGGLLPRASFGGVPELASQVWSPKIEAYQEQDTFIVCVELPGLKKEDVEVSVTEDAITIQGQRRQERRNEGEGFYHSEMSYGSFFRAIPLPEGAIGDTAEASFKDGVLEVKVQAPPHEVSRGRKIEITGSSEQKESAEPKKQQT